MKSDIPIFDKIPCGWCILNGALMAPNGYIFVCNRKSMFSKEYKHGLVKYEKYQDAECSSKPITRSHGNGG